MAIITADMIRMTVDKAKCNPEWLSAAINHDRCKRQIATITAGVTRPKVTLADFRALKIAVPAPHEQELMMEVLSKQQKLIATERAKTDKLQLQKTGLMHDLLTGELQVKVNDPEAAHV